MSSPRGTRIIPGEGPVAGGILVEIQGDALGDVAYATFGGEKTPIRRKAAGGSVEVLLPAHEAGTVDVALADADGRIIALVPGSFRFCRAKLAAESDLTRTVRALLASLKRNVIANTNVAVSVDYHGSTLEGMEAVRVAELPSIVLTGPRIEYDPMRSGMAEREEIVDTANDNRLIRYRPAYAVSLGFTITGAARTTVELLNFISGVTEYLARTRWLDVKDSSGNSLGRLEMDPDGELRTHLDGPDDIRAFTCGLILRGFDMSSHDAVGRVPDPATFDLQTECFPGGQSRES